MKILLAGATGAIGRPLLKALRAQGHEVLALTRNAAAPVPDARPVIADVLDRNALLRAVDGISADVVIHQLTALSKPPARYADMEMTNRLRTTGTTHLLAAARAVGARRFLTQSMVPGYGYTDHGTHVLTERDPFGQQREGKTAPIVAAMASTEQQVLTADGIEGIPPRRLPGWLLRLAAPYFAALMIDTTLRVSNAKAKAELGWTPTLPSYREGVHAPRN